jgi:hypothetical protein
VALLELKGLASNSSYSKPCDEAPYMPRSSKSCTPPKVMGDSGKSTLATTKKRLV